MDRFRLTLEGQTFDVEILSDPRSSPVQVRVDGQTLTVEVTGVEHRPEDWAAEAAPPGRISVPTGIPSRSGPSPVASAALPGRQQLIAPLPGTVLQVSVQAGQRVDLGDELLVIEAMKMNNRIRSPRNGTVSQVRVEVGQQISHGQVLLDWTD